MKGHLAISSVSQILIITMEITSTNLEILNHCTSLIPPKNCTFMFSKWNKLAKLQILLERHSDVMVQENRAMKCAGIYVIY